MTPVTPQEIKANLILRGISQVSIANQLGVTPSLVSMVIHGTEKSPKVRKVIARLMDKSITEIW